MIRFATVSPIVAVYIDKLRMYLALFGASKLYTPRQDCLGKFGSLGAETKSTLFLSERSHRCHRHLFYRTVNMP